MWGNLSSTDAVCIVNLSPTPTPATFFSMCNFPPQVMFLTTWPFLLTRAAFRVRPTRVSVRSGVFVEGVYLSLSKFSWLLHESNSSVVRPHSGWYAIHASCCWIIYIWTSYQKKRKSQRRCLCLRLRNPWKEKALWLRLYKNFSAMTSLSPFPSTPSWEKFVTVRRNYL